jgi:hypothetical protein
MMRMMLSGVGTWRKIGGVVRRRKKRGRERGHVYPWDGYG